MVCGGITVGCSSFATGMSQTTCCSQEYCTSGLIMSIFSCSLCCSCCSLFWYLLNLNSVTMTIPSELEGLHFTVSLPCDMSFISLI
jgi:hypothetical protein